MLRRQFIALATLVLALTPESWGQGHSPPTPPIPPPPIPTGPVLTDVPSATPRPTWLEDGADIRPAAATDAQGWAGETWPPAPMGTHGSACTFECVNPIFRAGATSTQLLVGAYYSSGLGPSIPVFDYAPVTIRHGWMLTSPGEFHSWPGNWEALCDVTGAIVTSDYGNWLVGSSVYLRYNLVELGSCLVPYAQVGAGFLLNDAYRQTTQRAIGQMFEFHLHYEVGLKYFVAPNVSLDLEVGFQHISNANSSDRNFGVNAIGAQVGFTYYFPWGQQ
jgi:hypothetical protein